MGTEINRRYVKEYQLPNQSTQELLAKEMTIEQIQELIEVKQAEFEKIDAYLYQLKYFMAVKKAGYGVGDIVRYRISNTKHRFMIVGWVNEGWFVKPVGEENKKIPPKFVSNYGLYVKA